MWSGDSADEVRTLLADIPELLRRSGQANGDVAAALTGFAPQLSDYQSDLWSFRQQGSSTADELESVERMRETRSTGCVRRRATSSRSSPGPIPTTTTRRWRRSTLVSGACSASSMHSNVASSATVRTSRSAVDLAVDLIRSADDVLYNNGWDEFWSKTLSPVLDVVRIVLEIATVVLVIAALIGSGGTLAPLIMAGLLLAVSAAKVIGTAAAGREVTGEMWLNLAIDFAAVATLGFARYAKGLKLASNANRVQADKILKTGRPASTPPAQHLAKMQKIDRLVKLADNVPSSPPGWARRSRAASSPATAWSM